MAGRSTPASIPPTRWLDGSRFVGRYAGLLPEAGSLHRPDGTSWTGRFVQSAPSGEGRLVLADGTVLLDTPATLAEDLDGAHTCAGPAGDAVPCHFLDGRRMASGDAYMAAVESRERERIAATLPPPVVEAPATNDAAATYTTVAAAPPPVPEPVAEATPAIDGCTWVEGRFVTDAGLSRLEFDGRGRGHLWQQTHGGSATYTFDIDFTYRGSRHGMAFEYGPAIYRDASGSIVNRQAVPGGEGDCAYDGHSITIGGQTYRRA